MLAGVGRKDLASGCILVRLGPIRLHPDYIPNTSVSILGHPGASLLIRVHPECAQIQVHPRTILWPRGCDWLG